MAFAIICDRSRYAQLPYYNCAAKCDKNDSWFEIHEMDSYTEFWGSSLVCFILGIYQIVGSVVTYNQFLYDENKEKKNI